MTHDEMIAVIAAHRDGKKIQVFREGRWQHSYCGDYRDMVSIILLDMGGGSTFRVAPESKLRPWKPEEVPMPCVLKNDVSGTRFQVLSVGPMGIRCLCNDFVTTYTCAELLSVVTTHSLDGGKTWKPCGVEEVV